MENIGFEIDTKPIEPVQSSVCLFGEKSDLRKSRPSSTDRECEKELEWVQKELANYKVQLEAKDAAYTQALLKLDSFQNRVHELSLKTLETDRDNYISQCNEAKIRIDELESKVKETTDQYLETVKLRDQLSSVLFELKNRQEELLFMEAELAAAKESELRAVQKGESAETAFDLEKKKAEELLNHIFELNEAILESKVSAIEEEKEKFALLSKKDVEIELATESLVQVQNQINEMTKQMEIMQGLENQLLAKMEFIDTLQSEVDQAKEQVISFEKAASDAKNEINNLRMDLEFKERESLDRAIYIESLETELNELQAQLKKANSKTETITIELNEAKLEINEVKQRESEAQVEIARLKSVPVDGQPNNSAPNSPESQQPKTDDNNTTITISVDEYESLIKKAKKADLNSISTANVTTKVEKKDDMENLKKELEVAMGKIGEFRNRAEQAISRAEIAEKAKTALEDQLRRWRKEKQKKKEAMDAVKEVSSEAKQYHPPPPTYEKKSTHYQPLSKILNMKF